MRPPTPTPNPLPLSPPPGEQVEGFSRRSSLGAKLEQKAVKLGLLPAGAEGPITRYIRLTVGRLLAARRNRWGLPRGARRGHLVVRGAEGGQLPGGWPIPWPMHALLVARQHQTKGGIE